MSNVIVIDESNQETKRRRTILKFYSRGTGVVHIDWRGKKTDQEKMDLVKFDTINLDEMAKARTAAMTLEKHGFEVSKDVYGLTKPIKNPNSLAAGK